MKIRTLLLLTTLLCHTLASVSPFESGGAVSRCSPRETDQTNHLDPLCAAAGLVRSAHQQNVPGRALEYADKARWYEQLSAGDYRPRRSHGPTLCGNAVSRLEIADRVVVPNNVAIIGRQDA
jgi:hypothetical protein